MSVSIVDLVLLGLLHDKPRSAYDIQKHIEYRKLTYWVKISPPSIYKKVIKLEQQGFLQCSIEKDGKMPEKTMYSMTTSGKKYFHSLMDDASKSTVNVYFDFNAVIVNLNKIPKKEALKLLENIFQNISTAKFFLEEMLKQRQEIPLVGKTIMLQQLKVYESLVDWCVELKKQVEEIPMLEKAKELPQE